MEYKRSLKFLSVTFIDPKARKLYLFQRKNVLYDITLLESLPDNPYTHKDIIVDYINHIGFLPYLPYYLGYKSIHRFRYFEASYPNPTTLVYLVYLDELPAVFKRSINENINKKTTIQFQKLKFKLKRFEFTDLLHNPLHTNLERWYDPIKIFKII